VPLSQDAELLPQSQVFQEQVAARTGRANEQDEQEPYSIFGIGVDQKHTLKWIFSQEKATFHGSQKVYVYSKNALGRPCTSSRPTASLHRIEA
jgi:hypothetical protein